MGYALSVAAIVLLCIALELLRRVLKRLPTADSNALCQTLRDEFRIGREESSNAAKLLREEVSKAQKETNDSTVKAIGELGKSYGERLQAMQTQMDKLTSSNKEALDSISATVENQLTGLRESNETKLEKMRETVDEKLHSTLERRLTESFKLVEGRLESVQQGLGEMRTLAQGVGDLKRVLTSVKVRGTWGEIRLGEILEQLLTPDQYSKNVRIRQDSQEVVEFAVKLPGQDGDLSNPVWLPIDAKFPHEDYERLVEAAQNGDSQAVQQANDALVRSVRKYAKDIHDKYVSPPYSTDFAIMFLPTEGLFAEILRVPGFHQELQLKYHVLPAGPTILAALLNSLRMGFRTLAIEQRSSEVWNTLAAVKTEFGKFEGVLDKVKKQLQTAANTIDEASTRTRAMERSLKKVEQIPEADAVKMLDIPPLADPAEAEGDSTRHEEI